MVTKNPSLDAATVKIVKQVLAMPPKPHEAQKVGRATKKKRSPKDRASSSKKPTA